MTESNDPRRDCPWKCRTGDAKGLCVKTTPPQADILPMDRDSVLERKNGSVTTLPITGACITIPVPAYNFYNRIAELEAELARKDAAIGYAILQIECEHCRNYLQQAIATKPATGDAE